MDPSSNRVFLRVAVERQYLTRTEADELASAARRRGALAQELAVELDYLSSRRVKRVLNHVAYRRLRTRDKRWAEQLLRDERVSARALRDGLAEQRRRFEEHRERLGLAELLVGLGALGADEAQRLYAEFLGQSSSQGVSPTSSSFLRRQAETPVPAESPDPEVVAADPKPEPPPAEPSPAEAPPAVRATPRPPAVEGVDSAMHRAMHSGGRRYHTLAGAVNRVEAILSIQHDLSSSGITATDSAEYLEGACVRRAQRRGDDAGRQA